jgi:hypothetical protein
VSNLFQDCLGDKLQQLSPRVRQAHIGQVRLEGEVSVVRGNIIANIICNIFGMPPAFKKCHLIVEGNHTSNSMTWNRRFNQHPMNSHFYKDGTHLVEKLGPIHMKLELSVDKGALTYSLISTRIFGVLIPKFFSPQVTAIEQQFEEQYRFSVEVTMPVIGKLVQYWGDMVITETTSDA